MSERRRYRRRRERNGSAHAGPYADAFEGRSHRNEVKNYKDLQLCREVFRTLSLSLAGGCGDDVLAGLSVRAVVPAPDASRLMVCLEPAPGSGSGGVAIDVADALARLARVAPRLRRDVAAALVRKRAPELEFVVLPRKEAGHE